MVESVRWLSKLHYYSSRIVPSRKSLLIHFCCEVASLFSNYLALESALCSDWLKYWRIVLLSNQKRVVFLSANQMLHLKQAAICVGHIPALSLATFRAFPVNQRCNILGEVVFFTENIMSSFLAWRELQLKCRRAVSLTLLNLLVSSIIQIHWRKKIKKKMIKWTSSNKSPWRQRKSWRITKNRFVFCMFLVDSLKNRVVKWDGIIDSVVFMSSGRMKKTNWIPPFKDWQKTPKHWTLNLLSSKNKL